MVQKRYFPVYVLLIGIAIWLLFSAVDQTTNGYLIEFVVLWIGYIYTITLFMLATSRYNMDILEPIVLMTFIYIAMFLISPMLSILNNNTLVCGVSVFSACIPGTVISLVAFSAYYYGYYKHNNSALEYHEMESVSVEPDSQWTFICVCGWAVCLAVTLLVVMSTGKSLEYILTLGNNGEIIESEYSSTPLGFISNLKFAMIGFWLYICVYSRSSILKIAIAVLTIIGYMAYGSRHVIIEMAIAFAVLYYTQRKKRPRVFSIVLAICILLIFSMVLGAMRAGFQRGTGYDLAESITWENLYYVIFTSNFDIYKVYYAIIQAIPSVMPFTCGEFIWDSLVGLVPRIIWPGKPEAIDSAYARVVMGSINEFATKGAAMAMPNLGAYYMEFGLIGCIIYPYLGGKFFGKVKSWFQNNNYSIDLLIASSILCGCQFQVLIRGSNIVAMLTTALFNLLPVLTIKICKNLL